MKLEYLQISDDDKELLPANFIFIEKRSLVSEGSTLNEVPFSVTKYNTGSYYSHPFYKPISRSFKVSVLYEGGE